MVQEKTILHIDDDPDDLFIFRMAMEELGLGPILQQEDNALRALHALQQQPAHAHPGLIVVDLNMPVLSGKDFLAHLGRHPSLHRVPVIVFTTSSLETDRRYCLEHGAQCLTKPSLFSDMRDTLRAMLQYRKEKGYSTY
jgi:CheY-like chemotaxis protein